MYDLRPPAPLPPPSAGGSPYRDAPIVQVVQLTRCIDCKQELPTSETNVVADGNLCDACFARR
jgi:hypothetical protein